MSIQIEIQEKDKKPLIEFYQNKLTVVLEEIRLLQDETESIKGILKKLSGNNTAINNSSTSEINLSGEYNKSWVWEIKAKYILKQARAPLTSGAISEILIGKYEPDKVRTAVLKSISSVLTSKRGQTIFSQEKNEKNENVYRIK